ncbi:hypothetical protein AB6A40_011086 [Gnathostoma spinigerum]|uniref:Uncharacterized protein n=1 Tax=Gnathostoma spinigerum TaxID=75299 RepID=A0ABD6F3J5_9BILA
MGSSTFTFTFRALFIKISAIKYFKISPATTSAAGITTNNNTSPDRGILQMQQTEQQSQAEQMIFLLLQERLAQQLRPQNDLQRIWQNVMLGLPALIPSPLEMASLPGTSQTFSHPLYQ